MKDDDKVIPFLHRDVPIVDPIAEEAALIEQQEQMRVAVLKARELSLEFMKVLVESADGAPTPSIAVGITALAMTMSALMNGMGLFDLDERRVFIYRSITPTLLDVVDPQSQVVTTNSQGVVDPL